MQIRVGLELAELCSLDTVILSQQEETLKSRIVDANSPPERVPGDKFIFFAVKDVVKFSEVAGVTNFKPHFPWEKKKNDRKFATKNPPGFSHGWGGSKIQNFIT